MGMPKTMIINCIAQDTEDQGFPPIAQLSIVRRQEIGAHKDEGVLQNNLFA